jgi:fructuronate reductase
LLIRLIAPETHIVSFTVTEKGYCRGANGGLDPVLADKDSFYPLIAEAMRRRCDAGISGLTLLSCDNLSENGRQLEKLMAEYLRLRDPDLLDWFHRQCACPSTMVDRIVPSTTDADRADLAQRIGLEDHGAVMTEPFSQWVVEDRFAGPRPNWQSIGVDLVGDVRPYETAKLRMLNGAHSLLAYCGLRRGHQFVHQAIRDPALRPLVERLMRDEAAPTIKVAPGQKLEQYANELIERFANTALNHRLLQIAMDGSQKVPQRWLETLAINQQRGRACPAILAGIAAWIEHLRGANGPVDDPRAAALSSAAHSVEAIDALFGSSGLVASDWRPSAADRSEIQARLL